jgi:DHA1 family tetracycline resistance protein-like MFS transporter
MNNADRQALLPLFLVIIIDMVGIGLIFPVLAPLFMNEMDGILPMGTSLFMREVWYSVTIGLFSLCMFFGAPFLGDLSDKTGRKKVLLLCLLGTAFGFFLCAIGIIYKSLGLLLLGRAVTGFAAGSQPLAQAAIADISTHENKASNLSLMVMAACFGFVIGPMLGGYFSQSALSVWFGLGTPFLIAALLALLNSIYLIRAFKETFEVQEKKKLEWMKGLTVFMDAFQHASIRKLSLVFLLIQLAWSLYLQFIALFLTQAHQFSAEKMGYFYGAIAFVFGLTLLLIMRICLRYMTVQTIAIWSQGLMMLGLLSAGLWSNEWGQWFCIIPIAMGIGMAHAALLTLFSNAVGRDAQGWVMGVSSAVVAMAWLLSGFASGILAYVSLIFPFMLAAMLAGAGCWAMRRSV